MEEEKVPIKFTKSNEHKTYPATGAFGGTNPKGEIICHFHIDKNKFPESLHYIADSDKPLTEKSIGDEEKEIIREIQSTIVMRPDVALSIGKWLINKAETVMQGVEKKEQK